MPAGAGLCGRRRPGPAYRAGPEPAGAVRPRIGDRPHPGPAGGRRRGRGRAVHPRRRSGRPAASAGGLHSHPVSAGRLSHEHPAGPHWQEAGGPGGGHLPARRRHRQPVRRDAAGRSGGCQPHPGANRRPQRRHSRRSAPFEPVSGGHRRRHLGYRRVPGRQRGGLHHGHRGRR